MPPQINITHLDWQVLKDKFVKMNTGMTTNGIRQKLHSYLEVADDKKVKAMYVMMQGDIEQSAVEYSDDFKKELDTRYADYKSGKAKVITATQSKKRIQELLKSRHKK